MGVRYSLVLPSLQYHFRFFFFFPGSVLYAVFIFYPIFSNFTFILVLPLFSLLRLLMLQIKLQMCSLSTPTPSISRPASIWSSTFLLPLRSLISVTCPYTANYNLILYPFYNFSDIFNSTLSFSRFLLLQFPFSSYCCLFLFQSPRHFCPFFY